MTDEEILYCAGQQDLTPVARKKRLGFLLKASHSTEGKSSGDLSKRNAPGLHSSGVILDG